MKRMLAQNTCLRLVIALLVIIVFTATSLLIGTGSVFASNPEYTNWQQYPTNPVFDPAERAYYPSIIFNGTSYQMWYDDGTATRYTTSTDGINWVAGTLVTGLTNGRHALVKWVSTKYMVWYWDSSQLYSINTIRTAESNDGITWTLDSAITQVGTTVITANPGPDWNAGSYGVCDLFYNAAGSATIVAPVNAATVWQNKFVMYYDGTTGSYEDIGIAVSADGKQWRGYNGGAAPVLAHGGGSTWDSNYATFCTVLKIDGIYHMWYSGGQTESNEGIGYAQSTDGISWTKYASNPILHKNDGVIWRSTRTYTPRVLYDVAGFSGAGEAAQLKMWYNGTAAGNYAIGYASITISAAPVTVGGRVNPVDKIAILAPYFGLLLLIAGIMVTGGLVLKKAIVRKSR